MSQPQNIASESVVSLDSTLNEGETTPTASTTSLIPKNTSPTSASMSNTSSSSGIPPSAPPPRDYEAAFASLSTSYGFSQSFVAIPLRDSKGKKDKSKAGEKKKKSSKTKGGEAAASSAVSSASISAGRGQSASNDPKP